MFVLFWSKNCHDKELGSKLCIVKLNTILIIDLKLFIGLYNYEYQFSSVQLLSRV